MTDRIVQRSILNVIHARDPATRKLLGEIPRTLDTPTSFAGVPGRGVPEAVALAVKLIRGGARAFALSDMKDFFPRVPRGEVVAFLQDQVDDDEFVALFRAALETEIQNRDAIAQWLDLFPITEVGVAQGSLLSVLVGNLALRQFDARLNTGPLTTIRYLDDFAIFGPSLDVVAASFRDAQEELAKLGMTCYEPDDGSQKAFCGPVADGFDFLGCRIHPDGVSPARPARRKLLHEIGRIIREARRQIFALGEAGSRRRTERVYAQTLVRIDKKVCGWGDAYRFVTNRVAFSQLDAEIDRMLDEFRRWFSRRYDRSDAPPGGGSRASRCSAIRRRGRWNSTEGSQPGRAPIHSRRPRLPGMLATLLDDLREFLHRADVELQAFVEVVVSFVVPPQVVEEALDQDVLHINAEGILKIDPVS